MMRVLEVIPNIASEGGGSVRSLLSNCRAIHRIDTSFDTCVCTTEEGLSESWRERLMAEMPKSVELRTFPAVGRGAFTFSGPCLSWIWRHAREFDLIVLRRLFNVICSGAAYVTRQRGIPYVVHPLGSLSRYTFSYRRSLLKRAYFRTVERRTLSGAAAIRFTSQTERSEAPDWGASTPTWVIPHPYEPSFKIGAIHEARPSNILFLSRWHPVKGIDVLLKAVGLVRQRMDGVRLVLAGSGVPAFERKVHAVIARLGLEGAVVLPGFVEGEAKRSLLRSSAVFALPSLHENFGMSVVEAMDAGLPVVIPRTVAIWPDVTAAGAGLVLEERTPEALASALGRLLENADLRREMGRRGQELVRLAFEPTAIGKKLKDLYDCASARGRSDTAAA